MPPADPDDALPLSDAEISALLAPFAGAPTIALAVSGGADSLGMMAAVARWRPAGFSVVVLSVDHRLQAGSGKVAAGVASAARRLGLEARVLTRKGPPPAGNVEGEARAARYGLLLAACRAAGASHLLTAHQRDDLAEGFLLRLKRRAGAFGLAAMRPAIAVGDVTIARPFLSVSRARLRATAVAAGLEPVEDPMNANPRFERARVRQMMPFLMELGLDADALASAAERLGDATDAIERAASAFLAAAVEVDPFAIAWLDVRRFVDLPHAVQLRVLARIVIAVGGDGYPPRHDRLLGLHGAILVGSPGLKRTLGGTVAQARDGLVGFYRETGRAGLPSVPLRRGASGVWDHRFAYEVLASAPSALVLAPSSGPLSPVIRTLSGGIPAAASAALPVVLRRGKALDPLPIAEGFPSDSLGYVTLRCVLRDRLQDPPLFPDFEGL